MRFQVVCIIVLCQLMTTLTLIKKSSRSNQVKEMIEIMIIIYEMKIQLYFLYLNLRQLYGLNCFKFGSFVNIPKYIKYFYYKLYNIIKKNIFIIIVLLLFMFLRLFKLFLIPYSLFLYFLFSLFKFNNLESYMLIFSLIVDVVGQWRVTLELEIKLVCSLFKNVDCITRSFGISHTLYRAY